MEPRTQHNYLQVPRMYNKWFCRAASYIEDSLPIQFQVPVTYPKALRDRNLRTGSQHNMTSIGQFYVARISRPVRILGSVTQGYIMRYPVVTGADCQRH